MRFPTTVTALLAAAACAPKHTYPDGSGLEGQLEREVIALHETISRLEAESACNGGQTDALYADLNQILPGRQVELSAQGNATFVVLPDALVFGSDLLSIRDEARMTLDMLATALNRYPRYTLVVEGHTADQMPDAWLSTLYPTLWDLSFARASAIKNTLVDQFHVDEHRFTVAARADTVPLASNDTAAGQTRNRRVVITIRPTQAQ